MCPLIRREQEPSLPPCAMGGHSEKLAFCKPGREPKPEPDHADPRSQT